MHSAISNCVWSSEERKRKAKKMEEREEAEERYGREREDDLENNSPPTPGNSVMGAATVTSLGWPSRILYLVLCSLALMVSSGFGFGLNGSFTVLAFLQIPIALAILNGEDREKERWAWTVLKFVLTWFTMSAG